MNAESVELHLATSVLVALLQHLGSCVWLVTSAPVDLKTRANAHVVTFALEEVCNLQPAH